MLTLVPPADLTHRTREDKSQVLEMCFNMAIVNEVAHDHLSVCADRLHAVRSTGADGRPRPEGETGCVLRGLFDGRGEGAVQICEEAAWSAEHELLQAGHGLAGSCGGSTPPAHAVLRSASCSSKQLDCDRVDACVEGEREGHDAMSLASASPEQRDSMAISPVPASASETAVEQSLSSSSEKP
eukprot:6198835-Pleurochrysis_carterae.AAC.1